MRKLTQKEKEKLQGIIKTKELADQVIRAQAILLLDQEIDMKMIQTITGFQRRQIYFLRARFLKEGVDMLKDQRKGNPPELLTKKQREEIIYTVQSSTPKDHGYNYPFWTTSILADHIHRTYGVKYKSKTSSYIIFKKAHFTYHQPSRRYDLQDPKEVEIFRREAKKVIAKHWDDDNTVILSGDEMVLTTATTTQKVWLPEGQSPYIEVRTGTRKRLHVYGFLNIKTGQEHAFMTELQNMYITKDILTKVRKLYPDKYILLFWDNAGWHKGSQVQEWLQEDKYTTVIHFPKYAPQENPQEHVWKKGRSVITHNRYIEDIKTSTQELVDYFNTNIFKYKLLQFSAIS